MKKFIKALLVLVIVLSLVGCKSGEYEGKPDIKLNDVTPNSFTYGFLELETKENNLVYSPLSIKYALTMLEKGAEGETKEEIDNLIRGLTLSTYGNYQKNLSFANGLFIRNTYKDRVKDSYTKTLKEEYDAEVIYDKFKNANNINSWIKDKTLGIIDKMLGDNLVTDSDVILVNALAIDMDWASKFETDRTSEGTFNNKNKDKVAYMNKTSKVDRYYIDENLTMVEMSLKKYGDTTLEFIAIMPKDLNKYINESNIELDLYKLQKPADKEELNITIPKFKFSYDLHLKDDLKALGVKKIFVPGEADLSGIATKDLFVTDALHKADIEFSEDGIKAAAVTVFTMKDNAIAPIDESTVIYLKFDKPFLFVIRDKENDEVWFTGTVYEPTLWDEVKNQYE